MYRNSIIYMAAGSGRRFGSNKLLYEFKGKPLYRHALDKIIEYVSVRPDTELIVVTRYDDICEYVKQYACSNIRISYSPQSINGISYTIHNGINAADNASEGYYFFVTADQPCLRIDTLDGSEQCNRENISAEELNSMEYRETRLRFLISFATNL